MNGINVLAVITARLNSSRLPKKHLLELNGQPLISHVFKRLEKVEEIDTLVLATTNDDFNRPLVDWCHQNNKQVYAFDGDVNDVVGRVDAIVKKENPSHLLYVCGDCPLLEPTTIAGHLKILIEQPDVDIVTTTAVKNGTPHIHCGFDVYARRIWNQVIEKTNTAEFREHVGSSMRPYYQNLQWGWYEDDPVFTQRIHRISVDTPSDYFFMQEVYRRWYEANDESSIVDLKWLIEQLIKDENLVAINSEVHQKTTSESSQPILLVTQVNSEIGWGHIKRIITIARALQDIKSAAVKLIIQGTSVDIAELALLPHVMVSDEDSLSSAVEYQVKEKIPNVVVFDIYPKNQELALEKCLQKLQFQQIATVSIDFCLPWVEQVDLNIVPSFFLSEKHPVNRSKKVVYGLDYLILPKVIPIHWNVGNKLLILTGSSDCFHLGTHLPALINESLPSSIEIHWVKGMFSNHPDVPEKAVHQWVIHENIDQLQPLMLQSHYCLSVYGLSLFESLQCGVPTVAVAMNQKPSLAEIEAFSGVNIAVISQTAEEAVEQLKKMILDSSVGQLYHDNSKKQIDGLGVNRMVDLMFDLVK